MEAYDTARAGRNNKGTIEVDYLVILFAKLIGALSALFGGGTNLPGQVALKLRPNILKRLVRGYRVILVTGTNGKTTTTAILQNILKQTGKRAVNSASGANMKGGVVSCLIRNFPILGKVDGDFAVLEVDEAYMRHITAEISPEVIAVTNIFRDQLDRYGEIDKTLALIEEACQKAPDATLVLNADEAMLGDFLPQNKHFYYGFAVPIRTSSAETVNAEGMFCKKCQTPYTYDFTTFSHLGAYKCPGCGFIRPEMQLSVDKIAEISADHSVVTMNGKPISIPQAGAYNIYNALCAAACAKTLGVSDEAIRVGIAGQKSKFGRQETVTIDKASMRIILIKNPAGAEEAIASVLPDEDEVCLGVLLNDNVGDGTDVSWIYDVDFEMLGKMRCKQFFVGGTRAYDMAVRMKTAGFETLKVCTDYETLLSEIRATEGRVYMFVTYSAMIGFRKFLHRKKYIRKLWF